MIELGHIAYYVSKLEQSLKFYHDALGLKVVGKLFDGRAAMLTGGRTQSLRMTSTQVNFWR